MLLLSLVNRDVVSSSDGYMHAGDVRAIIPRVGRRACLNPKRMTLSLPKECSLVGLLVPGLVPAEVVSDR